MQWRAGLCAVAAMLACAAPMAQAADAFGGKPKVDPNKEVSERLGRLEQQLQALTTKQGQSNAAGADEGFTLPTAPGQPPAAPVEDSELKLDYVLKGELNGKVLVKKGTRLIQMDRKEFEKFSAHAKLRARQQLAASVEATGPLGMSIPAPGAPPVPPAAATAAPAQAVPASKAVRRAEAAQAKAMGAPATPMPAAAPVKK